MFGRFVQRERDIVYEKRIQLIEKNVRIDFSLLNILYIRIARLVVIDMGKLNFPLLLFFPLQP